MVLIVGLGNLGQKYEMTRHSSGFMVVDRIASSLGVKFSTSKKFDSEVAAYGTSIMLAKPTTFMNNSGAAVKKLCDFYKISTSDLWVIHDDLDIKLGEYKIQFGIGPKVHNGINSIEEELHFKDFWRIRIGVDNRLESDQRVPGEEYVLQKFNDGEMEEMNISITKAISDLQIKLQW